MEEISAACEAFGAVTKVKRDKKRPGVAYCEFVSKVSARLATKRCVRIGRVLCKTVHLSSSTVVIEQPKAQNVEADVKKQKGACRTILVKVTVFRLDNLNPIQIVFHAILVQVSTT